MLRKERETNMMRANTQIAQELLQWLIVANDMLKQCMQQTEFTIGACKNMAGISEMISIASESIQARESSIKIIRNAKMYDMVYMDMLTDEQLQTIANQLIREQANAGII